jgi:hypothetical protein
MPSNLVPLVYLVALALPLWLLYRFHALAWYWHALAIVAALAIGLSTPPPALEGPAFDLAVGFLFVALFLWGIAAPIFRTPHDRTLHHR